MITEVIDRENPTAWHFQQAWVVVMSVVFRVKDLRGISPCLPVIEAEVELIAGTSADQNAVTRPKQRWKTAKPHVRRR